MRPLVLLGGVAIALLALGSRVSQAQPIVDGDVAVRIAQVRGMASEAGLAPAWGDFLALVAYNESKGNPQALNDDQKEQEAAQSAFLRNQDDFIGCGYPPSAYTFGSGGWFGIIPAVGLTQLGGELTCLDPRSIFDPRIATAMAVGFARGLMRWERYQAVPTWLNLRAMWGWPAKGGDLEFLARSRRKFEEHAAAIGLPSTWLDRNPPALTMKAKDVYARLLGGTTT